MLKEGCRVSDLRYLRSVQVRNLPRIITAASANAATNVTTDVSPEPVILQIQDNGNDLEEEGRRLYRD